ncbi:lactate dehydrogenase-like 2-hydroxyacid dehydrogenase [Caulobacter ginsengisoli]|uniref:Lactate dehydrogenase-like 2-hydroxyacid dehydrogenase n=1 Tax=Caulobacter ginsengisoli TaxID=400775 RepID=A0ABU0IRF0_9CAUL|nr:2-hydroxyacid dehydrogenase [Caulobacter ginsengisoli]MDQ0463574.1 lactate dehydrogenase-like 2-hydroxyacid dehydrogenase [Caulobacter ginsengisoli]
MSQKPAVLLSHPMIGPMQPVLEGAYEVHRFWDHADPAAFLAGPGQAVRAIVHAGEFRLDPAVLGQMKNLGLIANVSVGYDGVDVPWCRANGIEVTHSRGLNADDVADHAVGMLIAGWRGIVEGDQMVRAGTWTLTDRMRPRASLRGKKAGIVGLGHIGEAVGRRLEAFGMTVNWWGHREKPGAPWPMAASLLDLARDTDALMVCCRASPQTEKLISAEVIDAVGPRGAVINISRGQVVDEEALIAALKAGRLGLAGLDVFAQEPTPAERWADVPNTVLTPHSAGGTVDSIPLMVASCLENLRCFFAGEPLPTPVAD